MEVLMRLGAFMLYLSMENGESLSSLFLAQWETFFKIWEENP